jgi:tetratricopeptide (TPR) repeat protein
MRSLPLNFAALVAAVIAIHFAGPLPTNAQQENNTAGIRDVGHAAASNSGRGESWAVLMGPTKYSEAPELEYCENDVLTIADALIRSGDYDPKRIWFLGDGDTDFESGQFLGLKLPARENCKHSAEIGAIKDTLETVMAKTKPGDTLFIAFSGHGGLDDKQESYLVPLPGFHSPLKPDRALQVQWLLQQLEDNTKCQASRKIVILDACHSGGALQFDIPQATDSTRDREMLGTDHQGDGTLLITSCSAEEKSLEYPHDDQIILRQGIFSYFLAAALRGEAGADLDLDGSVTAVEAFIYTRDNVQKFVKEKKGAKQSPQWKVLEGNANFKIATVRERSSSTTESGPDFSIQAFTPSSGGWWFDETPLLVPRLRLDLSRQPRTVVTRPIEGETRTYDLETRARQSIGIVPKTDNLHLLKRLHENADTRKDVCNELINEMAPQTADDPTDLHLLAVLYGQVRNYKAATDTFKRALSEYDRRQFRRQLDGLLALCHADYAKTLSENNEYNAALSAYESALNKLGRNTPLPFKIYCLCAKSEVYRSLGEWDNAADALKDAKDLAGTLQDQQQLAHVHERSAWLEMDRWNVQSARESFNIALKLRSAGAEHNWPALTAALQDKHGKLAADRFEGKLTFDELDKSYEALINEISDQYDQQTRTAQKRALLIRLANTYERAADPHVFACDFTKLRELPQEPIRKRLQQAVSKLNSARSKLRDPLIEDENVSVSSRPRLLFKSAIAYALQGERGKSGEALNDGIEAQSAIISNKDKDDDTDPRTPQPAPIYQDISQAIVKLLNLMLPDADAPAGHASSSDSIEKQQGILRDVVVARGKRDRRSKLKRDEFELLLFASGLLAASHAQPQGGPPLQEPTRLNDIKLFKAIAYDLNQSPPQLRRFLRPYFTTAIRSMIQYTDLNYEDVAELILVSKYGAPKNYSGPAVLFHADEMGVVALIWTGQSWQKLSDCIAFDEMRRARVLESLFETLKGFKQPGTTVQVFWKDPEFDIGNDQFPDIPNVTVTFRPAD